MYPLPFDRMNGAKHLVFMIWAVYKIVMKFMGIVPIGLTKTTARIPTSMIVCIEIVLAESPIITQCSIDCPRIASYPGPHAERGRGPGETWQNSRMC